MAFDSGAGETLCRFLTDRDHYSPTKRIVRHTAFSPPRDKKLSVYWTTGLFDRDIWALGDTYVAPSRGPILGQGILNSLTVYAVDLTVELTKIPHPRHAEIVGWDADPKKARLRQVKLADRAQLALRE
jgi:hypothetical protein